MPARKRQRRGAAVVWWTLGFLAVGHLGFALFIALVQPGLRDPEYVGRFQHLRQRVREAPDRPLVLVLGSSRVLCGVAADELPPRPPGTSALLWHGLQTMPQQGPLVFNMGLSGAGPVNELICLRNLLDEGIRPRAVVIEILPRVLYPFPDETKVLDHIPVQRRSWRNFDLLAPGERWPCLRGYGTPPWFANRFCIMTRWAPAWVPADKQQRPLHTTGYGWLPYTYEQVTPEQYAAGLEHARREHGIVLNFTTINPKTDRVLRMMFELCRQHDIDVLGLMTMPESSEFRSWYRAETRELIDRYLTQLCREQGTRYVNAREWLPDQCFGDGHHQLPAGARRFTARLWQEVVQPWAARLGACGGC